MGVARRENGAEHPANLTQADPGGQLGQEDDAADDAGGDAGEQDPAGGDVQARPGPLAGVLVEATEQRLDTAIEQLGGQHQADAAEQPAPVLSGAMEDGGGGQDQGREEKVNGKTGMAADPELDPA